MANRRAIQLLAGLLVGLVLLLGGILYVSLQRRPLPYGTDLGAAPAPGFTLTNQFGKPVSLEALRGQVILLTFLDSRCKDICPLTAQVLARVQDKLGARATGVALVAVNLNAGYNRVEDAAAFSRKVHMDRRWDFLTGAPAQLEQVWRQYYVDLTKSKENDLLHSSLVYVIDRRGRQRAVFSALENSPTADDELAADVLKLL